jgi:hypothetical protein
MKEFAAASQDLTFFIALRLKNPNTKLLPSNFFILLSLHYLGPFSRFRLIKAAKPSGLYFGKTNSL